MPVLPRGSPPAEAFFRAKDESRARESEGLDKYSQEQAILLISSSCPKVKRGKRKSKAKFQQKSMNIMGNNAAGILNKLDSFKENVRKFSPGVYFVQETKSRRKNQIKLDDYVMFKQIRQNKGGRNLGCSGSY